MNTSKSGNEDTTVALSTTLSAAATPTMNKVDARYTCNDEELSKLRKDGPWKNDAKWFQSIDVSPTAIMKMVRIYCVSTVVVDLIYVMFMSILMYLIMIE